MVRKAKATEALLGAVPFGLLPCATGRGCCPDSRESGAQAPRIGTMRTCAPGPPDGCFEAAHWSPSGGCNAARQLRRHAAPAARQGPPSSAGRPSCPADLAEREGKRGSSGASTVGGTDRRSVPRANPRHGPSVATRDRACPSNDSGRTGGSRHHPYPAGATGARRGTVPVSPTLGTRHRAYRPREDGRFTRDDSGCLIVRDRI